MQPEICRFAESIKYQQMKTKNSNCKLMIPGIKYTDFMNQSTSYLAALKMTSKAREELTHRINSSGKMLTDTLSNYAHGKARQSPKAYAAIEAGLKELLRRIRISIGVNKKQSKEYIGFWKHLSKVCLADAAALRDLYLISQFESFSQSVHELKSKT